MKRTRCIHGGLLAAILVLAGSACLPPAPVPTQSGLGVTVTPSAVASPPSPTLGPPSPTPTGGSGQIVYVFQEGNQRGAALLDLRTGAKREIVAPRVRNLLVVYPLKVAGLVFVIEQAQGEGEWETYILDTRGSVVVFRGFGRLSPNHRWLIGVPDSENRLVLCSLVERKHEYIILTNGSSSGNGEDVYRLDKDGLDFRLLHQGVAAWGPSSPDGRQVLISSDTPAPLRIGNIDGTGMTELGVSGAFGQWVPMEWEW